MNTKKEVEMKKVNDYRIVEVRYDANQRLEGICGKEVRDLIKENWVPIGGICHYPNTGLFVQAMVKYQD